MKNARLTFDAEIHSGETALSDAWGPRLTPLGIKAATFLKPTSNLTRTRQLFDFSLASVANNTGYRNCLFHTFLIRQETTKWKKQKVERTAR